MKKFLHQHILIILIVFVGSFLRFFNPLWDNGLFLHPDERLFVNASNLSLPQSISDLFSPNSPLNPHMFYYGSLLLYIYKLISLFSPFSFLMTSRLISAFFSALTIGIIYGIGKELFSRKIGLMSSILFACAAGSIQYAHFNTTESSLIFLISLITYIDVLAVKKRRSFFIFFSLLFVGIAGAIKITGLTFGISSLLAFSLLVKEGSSWKKTLAWFCFGCTCSALFYILLSPYQFIDWKESYAQQSYMQAVTYGVFKPPFVIIYQNTLPYIYQATHVFPFVFGFVSFPLAVIGLGLLLLNSMKNWKTETKVFFLFAFPLIYFSWSGNWFAKYARYYLLLLPFLSVWAGYALSKIHFSLRAFLLFLVGVNGILFVQVYLHTNTRIAASEWIYTHIPDHSTIATEHWDDALPILLPDISQKPTYIMHSLPVYNTEDKMKIATIAAIAAESDYIILSSRRVYISILRNENSYPQTSLFYKKLFSGKLGFKEIYEKTNYPFFISDDYADETFQSYDHPPVVIFSNEKHFSEYEITSQLLSL